MGRIWEVYQHTNKFNGKSYIGITSRGWDRRWKQHVYDAGRGSSLHFHNAIRKYGVKAFSHEVLITVDSLELANEYEQLFIELYGTISDHYGYNSTAGGKVAIPSEETRKKMRGRTVSEETRKKLSDVNKGKTLSEETRKKISEALSGEKNYMYGKSHSEEMKANFRSAKAKGIYCAIDVKTFDVVVDDLEGSVEAGRWLLNFEGRHSENAEKRRQKGMTPYSRVRSKSLKPCPAGFIWCYKRDLEETLQRLKAEMDSHTP